MSAHSSMAIGAKSLRVVTISSFRSISSDHGHDLVACLVSEKVSRRMRCPPATREGLWTSTTRTGPVDKQDDDGAGPFLTPSHRTSGRMGSCLTLCKNCSIKRVRLSSAPATVHHAGGPSIGWQQLRSQPLGPPGPSHRIVHATQACPNAQPSPERSRPCLARGPPATRSARLRFPAADRGSW